MLELLVLVATAGCLFWVVRGAVAAANGRVRWSAVGARLGVAVVVFLAGVLLVRVMPSQQATFAPESTPAVVSAPAVNAEPAAMPSPAPEPTPAPASSGYTDAQNLAIIDGRDPDDAEIAAQYARLDAVCPKEGPSTGDMVAKIQSIVKRESGRDLSMLEVMRQMYIVQQGPAQEMGMKCSETGAMLAKLLIKGM